MNEKALRTGAAQADSREDRNEAARTLSAEHAGLLREVRARCAAVIAASTEDHWPAKELHRLLDYLHIEVLQQVANEEWLLFRNWHHQPQALHPLRADHLNLRLAIEALTDAATDRQLLTGGQLTDAVTAFQAALQAHFTAEQSLLDQDSAAPSTASLGSTPHEWYAYTEGPVVDLAKLPGPQGAEAVLARLLRLGRGERVELHAATDPSPLWRHLAAADPKATGSPTCITDQSSGRWKSSGGEPPRPQRRAPNQL